ncbi:hypothetical protein BDV95DRAFT_208540 [Massariosphaeria phaeospora]|uniref:Uncharacterized protein n=1 Tax=Massariosphaeria phaeospora TaxID=100035 RepID=A0A7C8M2S2_9PLEO|nr:hypothetical protein BDV95DRAFT_208540 [Massariosphaeria phaeospora]
MTYADVEEAHESTPMLGENGSGSRSNSKKRSSSMISHVLEFFGGGIYAPSSTTYEPIEILLNTEDEKERDRLTEMWKDNKLSELNFVGVVVCIALPDTRRPRILLHVTMCEPWKGSALLAGVLTSTGSWPDILPGNGPSPWPVRTSWYCGIILALFSILTAADQTVRLHRLASHRDGLRNIRNLLANSQGRKRRLKKSGRVQASSMQILTWQMPVMFLTTATICMIVGMFLHVWSATRYLEHAGWWNEHSKVALTYTIVATISIALFFTGQVTFYAPDDDQE